MPRDPDHPLYDPQDEPEDNELEYYLMSIWEIPEDDEDDE